MSIRLQKRYSHLYTSGLRQNQTLKILHIMLKKDTATQFHKYSFLSHMFNANKMHLAYSAFTVNQIRLSLQVLAQTLHVLCVFYNLWDAASFVYNFVSAVF